MRALMIAAFLCALALPAAADEVAPTGTLRAVYLASNRAQAVRDPATGTLRGASYELATELGRRLGVAVDFKPLANPAAVIAAVGGGEADIGFVAYEPSRAGPVEFSQTYMLVQQTTVVAHKPSTPALAGVHPPGRKDD